MRAGEMINGYQAQAQAPLDYIRGERTARVDGMTVKGAYSDPWWVYNPEQGWAVARTWRSKAQTAWVYHTAAEREATNRTMHAVDVPAIERVELTAA